MNPIKIDQLNQLLNFAKNYHNPTIPPEQHIFNVYPNLPTAGLKIIDVRLNYNSKLDAFTNVTFIRDNGTSKTFDMNDTYYKSNSLWECCHKYLIGEIQ